jgi:hypothetical protein
MVLARRLDNESATGRTTVLARWRDVESAARRMAVLASWLDDESAAGRTLVLARWRDDESAVGRTTVLARWHDDESAAGRMTLLARWRDNESAAGRKAQGTPPACNHWRDNQQYLEQWEQDSLLPTARMLTEGLLARQRVGSGAERSLAGATTSRRQDGRRCLPTGATTSRRRGERWYLLTCVTMVLTAGRMTVLRHRRPSLAHWHDDELAMGPMAVLVRWRNDVSVTGCKAVLAHSLVNGRRYPLVRSRLARQRISLNVRRSGRLGRAGRRCVQ